MNEYLERFYCYIEVKQLIGLVQEVDRAVEIQLLGGRFLPLLPVLIFITLLRHDMFNLNLQGLD